MAPQAKGEERPALTAYVAGFAARTAYADIPAPVVALGKKSILDTLACALSGSVAPGTVILRRYCETLACGGAGVSVIGAGSRLAPRFAALVNGYAMHADDFDDTYQAKPGRYQGVHATAPVLGAVLADAEARGASGKDLLRACHVGIDVASRIFDATDVRHILNGLHATATCGILGAAAGVSNLRGHDPALAAQTLGFVADQAFGLLENLGTMSKAYHSGRPSEYGIVAADLAEAGFSTSPVSLEARWGFFQATGGGCHPDELMGKLGSPWTFADRGQWLKPWPTGSLGHPALTKMQEFVRAHDIKPEQVARVRVKTSENIRHTLFRHRPTSKLEAKFSLEFALATMLLERTVNLFHFTDEFVRRQDVQEFIRKVDYQTYPEAEARAGGYTLVTAFLEVELKDGRKFSGRIDYHKGTLANPMSDDEVADKFRHCAEFAKWPKAKAEDAIAMVRDLETLADVSRLTAALSAAG
ncbi:MAG: MmgE/PrpD family protein [Proteobacteria bacterium]|nr:MmgE/PrpD family protein [Pseudomonadota bacterium]